MKKQNSSILISILMILLCIILCVGVTYAFFTDSATSSGNKIQAGKLQVDFQLLSPTTSEWNSIKNDETAIFNYEYWEPGYTDIKILKVVNEGSLAIAWKAKFISGAMALDLADAIEVYVNIYDEAPSTYPVSRAELASWGEAVTLNYFINNISTILKGELLEHESVCFGIALYMPVTVEDNMLQGKAIGPFDIQIVATQLAYESDAFGPDYDKDAESLCDHIPGEWVVEREPTSVVEGVKQTVCKVCGSLIQEPIYLSDSNGLSFSLSEDRTYYIVTGRSDPDLTEIVIPTTYNSFPVKEVGDSAFWCSWRDTPITDITIPEGITTIGERAFQNCSQVSSIILPDSVQNIGMGAFSFCSNLKTFTIPEGITSIPASMLEYCTSLESVIIPSSVTSIGAQAFYNCYSLENISIPAGVTSIGESAFSGCSNLTSVEIPKGITIINDGTFRGCSSLTSIEIPNSVTSIGFGAFSDCSDITNFEIPENVTSIGDEAFSGCSSLTTINIPEGVTSISSYMLHGTASLTSFVIPDHITSIGNGAFCESGVTSIVIPGSVISIGDYAFWECENLVDIMISESVTSIGVSVLAACTALESITVDPNNAVYYSDGNCLIEGESQTLIAGCKTSVIPEGVISIGEDAFRECSGLTSIEIPNSVTSIGETAFYNCIGLKSITIPDSVEIIDWGAFKDCNGLMRVVIGNGVTSIGGMAFCGCTGLISVTVGNNVQNIDTDAFSGCFKLIEVYNLSNFITITKNDWSKNGEIAYNALDIYTSLDEPSKLWMNADGYIFYENATECYLVGYAGTETELILPNDRNGKPYELYEYAFVNSLNLTSVIIPEGVQGNLRYTFYRCGNLVSVVIPDSLTGYVTNAFEDCVSLKNVALGGITAISGHMFKWCSALESIVIPDGVTEIGHEAFYECDSLTNVVIPNSVTDISYNAFNYCESLTTITFKGTAEQWEAIDGHDNFYGIEIIFLGDALD